MASYWDRIKPWTCSVCGERNISANKNACPKCSVLREGDTVAVTGTPAADAPATSVPAPARATRTQATTREYESEMEMRHGIEKMAQDGWAVTSQSSYTPKKGLTRTLAGGLLFFNPKPRHIVTFTRER